MDNVRKSIRESLRRRLLLEYVPLDVSKYLRNVQLQSNSGKNEATLDKLFGKGVFRIYYDLDSGNQININKKTNDLPVKQLETLRDEIGDTLDKFGYSVISFEGNRAKNDKGQTVKITKVLNRVDKLLLGKYDSYLSVKSKTESDNKLYVVVSRHSHDIADMGGKPRITSCADMGEMTTDNLDRYFKYDDGIDPGGGQSDIIYAIIGGDIIFYLIEDGDWNIKDPISRFLGGKFCEFSNNHNFYGEFNEKFAEFVNAWLAKYGSRINPRRSGDTNNLSDIDVRTDSFEKLYKLISGEGENTTKFVLSKLLKFDRFDIIERLLNSNKSMVVLDYINQYLGIDSYKSLPKNIHNLVKSKAYEIELKEDIKQLEFLYKTLKDGKRLLPAIKEGFLDMVLIELNKAHLTWNRWSSFNKDLPLRNINQHFNREDFDKALKLTSYVSKLLNQKSMNDRINDIKHLKNSLEV